MKHTYASAFALLTTLSTAAQPTLNSGSVTVVPGDQIMYSSGEYLQPGPGGVNQVWDYSASALDSPGTISYISPAATGMAGTFPNATVALDGGAGNYLFYRGTANSYEDDGSSISGTVVTCSDRQVLVQYPLSYNAFYSDGMICNVSSGGNNWTQSGYVNANADGWGTVVTAAGTVTNVLRVHTVREIVDNQFTPATTYTNNSYYYYKPGVHGPVVVMDHSVTDFFGILIKDSSLVAMSGGAIGMHEAMAHDIGVDVMPNPVNERLEVLFGTGAGLDLTIDIIDASGRLMGTQDHRTSVAGVHRIFLEMGQLKAGVYVVRVTDENGAMGMKRVVKQ